MNSLYDLCLQCVGELAAGEGWGLPPEGIRKLVEEVLPYVEKLASPTAEDIRRVVRHYRRDGPMVQAMLSPGSTEGERLWQEWRTYFLRLAASKGIFGEDAEDLAQTACERALHSLTEFHFCCSLRTWLVTTFVNCLVSWVRRKEAHKRGGKGYQPEGRETPAPARVRLVSLEQERGKELLLERLPEASPSPEEVHEQAELAYLLERELTGLLRSEEATILRLYYIERYYVNGGRGERKRWTDEAIGRVLGLSRSAVTARRRRALARLKANPAIRALALEILGRVKDETGGVKSKM